MHPLGDRRQQAPFIKVGMEEEAEIPLQVQRPWENGEVDHQRDPHMKVDMPHTSLKKDNRKKFWTD